MKKESRVFEEVNTLPDFAKDEEKVITFWEENKIFDELRKKNKGKKLFRWLEGPPTANGLPHIGHVLTRVIKDVFLRFKAMNGYNVVPWIAGWDCHGLPVELEVEKQLGITSKKEIEEYGVKSFNLKCKESVFRYEKAWREMTTRIGFWLDMDHPYITMDENYIESVWWAIKEIWKKGLLYLGHKVVPYCPRCGTPLSTHEVGQGMRETTDPSIYVKFKALDFPDTYFLAWTTTPWTLISNVCLTVHPDVDYVLAESNGERLILAEVIAENLLDNYIIIEKFKGKELEHKRYEQLFPFVKPKKKAFFVTLADYVTTEEGTGIVHSAPAFGEDDAKTGKRYGLPVINPVLEDGTFSSEITDYKGLFVKDADKLIIKDLKKRGLLFKQKSIKHTYPFCPRCDSPLLYYATETWYIKMTSMRENLLNNNEQIRWQPQHLKYGRFGNFIKDVRDWALSRNRYWGTPLPIWICKNNHVTVVGSKKELETLSKQSLPEEFSLHRPWVDEIKFSCPECGETAERVPYVIDCWFDSGSAPFAQYHYPFENRDLFDKHFPFDFITEAMDQTRGWFYTLLAIGTVLFDKPAYKSCLTMGLILDDKGYKMSKSKGNVVLPDDVIPIFGADATRWYLYSSPTWNAMRFSPTLVQESMKKFILTLWNGYSFFVSNANVDNFEPNEFTIPLSKRSELDRWLISELNYLINEVKKAMEDLSVHRAVDAFEQFVIEKFSNWYLRQSRRRFWKETLDEDKKAAYTTTYEVLVKLSKMLAPFIPFVSERIYQNLVRRIDTQAPISVHLCDYPKYNKKHVDSVLSKEMNSIVALVSTGRSIRAGANIKLRQPLSELIVITPLGQEDLIKKYEQVLKDELNVKKVTIKQSSEDLVRYTIKPNYKVLAPKVKSAINTVKKFFETLDEDTTKEYVKALSNNENIEVIINGKQYRFEPNDLQYGFEVKEGFTGEQAKEFLLLFNTKLTKSLKQEGYVRDLIRRVQTMRKELDLAYTQSIRLVISCDEFGKESINKFKDYIMGETLSKELIIDEPKKGLIKTWKFDGYSVTIGVEPL
ncbi:MAG: isoleucine--tRNA ligase [Candidatus Heimdallarchaeaceae archaeon]